MLFSGHYILRGHSVCNLFLLKTFFTKRNMNKVHERKNILLETSANLLKCNFVLSYIDTYAHILYMLQHDIIFIYNFYKS